MRILAVVLILLGLYSWAMMEWTNVGYNPGGIVVTIVSIIVGLWFLTEKD